MRDWLFALAIIGTGALGGYGMAMALIHAEREPPSLPHRPVDSLTNWGQGRTPLTGRDPEHNLCPAGTIAVLIDGMFLECQRLSAP